MPKKKKRKKKEKHSLSSDDCENMKLAVVSDMFCLLKNCVCVYTHTHCR